MNNYNKNYFPHKLNCNKNDFCNFNFNHYNCNCCPPKKESPLCSLFVVEHFLSSLQQTCNIMNIYKFFR